MNKLAKKNREFREKIGFSTLGVDFWFSLLVHQVREANASLCSKNELQILYRTWIIDSLWSSLNSRDKCRKANWCPYLHSLLVFLFFPIHTHTRIVCRHTALFLFWSSTCVARIQAWKLEHRKKEENLDFFKTSHRFLK